MTVPYFVYLAASDGEETIWAQMLLLVMLAAGGGIYTFIKTRSKSRRSSRGPISIHRNIFNHGINGVSRIIKTAGIHIPMKRPAPQQLTAENAQTALESPRSFVGGLNPQDKCAASLTGPGGLPVLAVKLSHAGAERRDLKSGMELLAGSFLVKIIESRQAQILADDLDIEMQKMCFAEMKRRNELEAVSSEALKTYTVDEAGHFGKTIRRQAMEELFHRTGQQET